VLVFFKPEHQPGIDGAGAGGHHQTFQRGETHGGVDAATIDDRSQRRARAKMAGNDPQVLHRLVEQLRGAVGAVGMGESMESIAADVVTLPPLLGHRIGRRCGGDGGVEGGVETCYRDDVGQPRGDRVERGQRLRLMQRRQIGQIPQLLLDGLVDANRTGEAGTAVHDAMTDHIGRVPLAQHFDEVGGVEPVRTDGQIRAVFELVVPVEQAQLETR
jgi:hypothetical protein